MDNIQEVVSRGVANIIPTKQELEKKLKSGEKLNIYLGIDPTSTKIHLGHAVVLRKLQQFVELNHNVTFLIGDYTALIGDTSDKDSERPALTENEIIKNFQTYKKQAEKVLDFSTKNLKIRRNSEWLKKLNFKKVLELTMEFSLGDFVGRELIKKRLVEGKRIGLHETLYPIMQAYDSFVLNTDLQIGGTDQTSNIQSGRTLIKNWRNKESFVLTTPILEGTDGRKMSKSWGNAIWLQDTPENMYAKLMAINDDLIIQYYTLATNLPMEKVNEIEKDLKGGKNPMLIKKQLALQITKELHNAEKAKEAEENFRKTVQEKETPQDIPTHTYTGPKKKNIVDLLVDLKMTSSKAEAKRLVEQGGVSVSSNVIKSALEIIEIKNGLLIKTGKRNIKQIKTS
ncbi:tyrosine--tRNA ligase [Patescibacteria group bacterium]|nr:tyrosine--tRNA ligase [Patescibacteria group bacterium]